MHRGCFVWTPTPPFSGRRTPRPAPARVCMCVLFLSGSGGPASRARFGAPHLSFGRSWCALCLFGPLRSGLPRLWLLLGFFFSLPPPCCAPVVSCFACFPAPGALGLGVLSPPPPPFLLFFPLPPPLCAPLPLAFRVFRPRVPWASASCCPPPLRPPFFLFVFCPPPCCLWRFLLSGCLGPLRPPPLFFSCFSPSFLFFFPVLGCRAVLGRRVCRRVPRWCCPCRCSVCVGWCCVVLAVGPGCPVLSPGVSWCRATVVLSLSRRVARRPVVQRGVSWCSSALCCVLLRCAVMWWCAVVLCRLFASLPVPVVCFLPLRVCCVCSGVSCCVFPVLSALCGAVLRCACALWLCCARRLCCFW